MNQSSQVAVYVTSWYMSKDIQIFGLSRQVLHSQRALDITFDCSIQSLIEVNACSAVDYYVASVGNLFEISRWKTNVLFLQIPFTNFIKFNTLA